MDKKQMRKEINNSLMHPPVGSPLGHDLELLSLPASKKVTNAPKRPHPALPSNVP